ncbi:MAG TPA: di-heme oxidoredictase family protein [Pyrinomonadaceae bacterium]|nr:di-heme oxidoredictase family protein [Pyrinomonadaceae bacterium]
MRVERKGAKGVTRIGRFGWKDSIASLLTFSAAAYVNEVGVTSPLQPNENTSLGRNVSIYDTVADPEATHQVPEIAVRRTVAG